MTQHVNVSKYDNDQPNTTKDKKQIVDPKENGVIRIKNNESFPTHTAVLDTHLIEKNVKITHKSGNVYGARYRLDVSGLSDRELLELAARSIVIDMQASARKCEEKMLDEKWGSGSIDVKEYYEEKRKLQTKRKKSDAEKFTELVDKISDAELAAILRNRGVNVVN